MSANVTEGLNALKLSANEKASSATMVNKRGDPKQVTISSTRAGIDFTVRTRVAVVSRNSMCPVVRNVLQFARECGYRAAD